VDFRRTITVLPILMSSDMSDRECDEPLRRKTVTHVSGMKRYPSHRFRHLGFMVAKGGIEPPTRGFSTANGRSGGLLINHLQRLPAPLPRPTMAHSWHTQSGLVTFLAQRPKKHRWYESSRSGSACFAASLGPWIIEVNGSI
jgi:hypothetical protein